MCFMPMHHIKKVSCKNIEICSFCHTVLIYLPAGKIQNATILPTQIRKLHVGPSSHTHNFPQIDRAAFTSNVFTTPCPAEEIPLQNEPIPIIAVQPNHSPPPYKSTRPNQGDNPRNPSGSGIERQREIYRTYKLCRHF